MAEQFALKNNQVFVLAEAAGGVYNSDQLRVLCEVADNESAFLKITEDQRIGFMVDPNKLADVQAQVRKSGLLLRSYKSSGVPAPRACLGELCTFAHQPSLGDALELTTHLLKSFPAPKRYSTIGINGCQRACLGSATEDIHVVAEESGYKISIGGKGSDISQQAQLILENVPRAELPLVIEKILAVFYQESLENERIFDVIERIGLTPFFNVLPEHLSPHVQQHADEQTAEESAATDNLNVSLDELLDSTDGDLNSLTAEDPALPHNALMQADPAEPATDEEFTPSVSDSVEQLADIPIPEDENEPINDGLAGDLLEVSDSDLEEGSLEDVERVRDAIRTELSMSAPPDASIRAQQTDLLDDVPDFTPENEGFTDLNEPTPEDTANLIDDALAEGDDFGLLTSQTAADVEHQKPRKLTTETTRSVGTQSRRASPLLTDRPVGGRLSIRFEGDQLAVELPSGLSFELPFESVEENGELTMSLPDGELRIARSGQTLAVSLGMLNLKIPIPATLERQVA